MSQSNRTIFAAAGLAAALFLTAPAPSSAAALWEGRDPGIGVLEQLWGWIHSFWSDRETSSTTVMVCEQDGGAVIPDGQPHNLVTPPPPPSVQGGSGR